MFKLFNHISLAKVIAILFAVSPFLALGFISDTDAATKFNIRVDPSIELAIDNNSPSILLDSPDGEIHQSVINATITTNNPTGYTIAVLMNNSNLINQSNPNYVIPTLEENVLPADFAINRWGILKQDSYYHPASSGMIISTSSDPATNVDEQITFGVRINAEMPSGVYDCDLTVVAIANRIPYTIETIDFMQEIDEDVIDSMVAGEQYQLTDIRDDKKYFVAKIGNDVWMTENLDFALSAEGTDLSPDTSDVIAPKTLAASTNISTWGQDITAAYYKDAGALYRPNGLDVVADSSALAADSDDQHYQLGSYYSWNAATAGSGATTEVGAAAAESICPKGWKLPTAAEEFGYMEERSTHRLFFNMFEDFHEVYTRYAHTPNVRDDGTNDGNYANNLNPAGTVITIPGATRIHVRLKYATESCCDRVVIWPGAHPDYNANSHNSSSYGAVVYAGSSGNAYIERDFDGESVTFGFRSDGSSVNYGYHAIVTGYDADGKIIRAMDAPINLDNLDEDAVVNANEVMPLAPYWMNYAGIIDSTHDWTATLRSAGYWSANYADNNQAYSLFSQEIEEEVDPGEGGEPETTTYFNAHPNSKIDTTKGLNIRCVAKPASFGL
jgi:hypothetical protein